MWGIAILLFIGTLIQFIVSGSSALNIVLAVLSILFLASALPFTGNIFTQLGLKGYLKNIVPVAIILLYLFSGIIFFPYKEEKDLTSNYSKAAKLMSQKEFEKSEKIFAELETKYPKDDQILLGKALLYMQMKNYDKALDYLNKAYQLNPYNVNIHYNMALVSYHKGNKPDALKRFEDIISINSRFLRPRLYAGTINMELGDYTAAIYQLNGARFISPDSLEVQYNLGKANFAIMNYGEARAAFKKALELKPPKEIKDEINGLLEKINSYIGGDMSV